MIDREKFNETYKHYGREILVDIIGLWEADYDSRIAELTKNIAERNFKALDDTAHSFKGTVVNFYYPEPVKFAYLLERMGKKEISDDGIEDIFEQLKVSSDKLLIELKQHLKTIS